MKKIFLVLLFTTLCVPVRAAIMPNVYITQSGAGTLDGLSCANGQSAAFFNTSGNWSSSGPIGPGTTVHLCGTLNTELIFQADGVAGSPITFLFEPGAKLSAPTWPTNSTVLGKASGNYLIVDGGSNGLIEATNNGSAQAGYAYANDITGVGFTSCNHCEVKNLTISNLFVHIAQHMGDIQDGCTLNRNCGGGILINGGSNNRVDHNTIHDAGACLHFGMGSPSTNLEMDHNVAYHCNWTYSAASGGDGNTDAVLIHDNEGYDWANWDDLVNNTQHHNGLHLFMLDGSGVLTNLQVYNNYFHGDPGQTPTAQIFIESPGGPPSGQLNNITGLIFNNLLTTTVASTGWSNGAIAASNVSTTSHITLGIYNNTIYASDAAGQDVGVLFTAASVGNPRTTITMENNIFRNVRVGYGAGGSLISDYNTYYLAGFNWDGAEPNYAAWLRDCNCDVHSQNGNDPLLDTTTFIPRAGSPVIGFGTNLVSLGISNLDKDKGGNARPLSGAWAVGAYGPSGITSATPLPPSNLFAIVQ